MKKVLCIAIAGMMAASAAFACETCGCAADDEVGNIGIGYQGVVLGNLLNGVAVRGKPAPLGWQVELVQGMADLDGPEVDLLIVKGKAYYALVERDNSCLYAGASVGYWSICLDDVLGIDVDGFSVAPLIGAEWNFAELPELGFNFEVSYEIDQLEVDDADIGLFGVTVSTGVTYYF